MPLNISMGPGESFSSTGDLVGNTTQNMDTVVGDNGTETTTKFYKTEIVPILGQPGQFTSRQVEVTDPAEIAQLQQQAEARSAERAAEREAGQAQRKAERAQRGQGGGGQSSGVNISGSVTVKGNVYKKDKIESSVTTTQNGTTTTTTTTTTNGPVQPGGRFKGGLKVG